MMRTIVGVIAGYVVMALLIFAAFSTAYLVMGADAAFRPGSYEVSGVWLATSFTLGLVAAIVGGYVCASIARSDKAPMALAALVLALGIVVAVFAMMDTTKGSTPRGGSVSNMEAMQNAIQPGWVMLLSPVVSAAGIMVGAGLRRRKMTAMAVA